MHPQATTTQPIRQYRRRLAGLKEVSDRIPNTRMGAVAKVQTFIKLMVRYENVQLDKSLTTHPYSLTDQFVLDAIAELEHWHEVLGVEAAADALAADPGGMEDKHRDLFQMLWTKFNPEEYRGRIGRFERRLADNGIGPELLSDAHVIDFGCGHANFCHAFLNRGAASVTGIDYGADSIEYAIEARDALAVQAGKLRLKTASVYRTAEPSGHFDFAVQNGVFHHLDDEDAAYREVHRVLKPGGWFWVYTDGSDGINLDILDACREALAEIPAGLVPEVTQFLNLETGKRYHMGDALNAVYRHTTWADITRRLSAIGFEDFRRLDGSFDTDTDPNIVSRHNYGIEKFGEGDIRLICRKSSNRGRLPVTSRSCAS